MFDEADDILLCGFPEEPPDFRPPPVERPTTVAEHRMRNGRVIKLQLLGSHPIYGYLLWNAGRVVADFLETHADSWVRGRTVLELGAGAALPSLVAALVGARFVVATDYNDPAVVRTMCENADGVRADLPRGGDELVVRGYTWGVRTEEFLAGLPLPAPAAPVGEKEKGGTFDLLILADVIYTTAQHGALVATIRRMLRRSRDAMALVASTAYQPQYKEKIWAFFPLVEANGFVVTELFKTMVEELLFEDDPGDPDERRTVSGYALKWKEEELVGL